MILGFFVIAGASNQNVSYGYRLGNRVLYPVIEPGAALTVYCNSALKADGNLLPGIHTTVPERSAMELAWPV